VTYAPADLLNIRTYLAARTGLDLASLGIAGDSVHAASGGYHEGRVDLAAAGRLGYDYSVVESWRDSDPTDGASALDVGDFAAGGLDRHAVTRAVLTALNSGDPRAADIREMIYSLDDSTVHRWDALGIRDTGDDSHLWHTHISFFRDSEGRRGQDNNFLGLLREIFEGPAPQQQEDDMPAFQTGQLKPGFFEDVLSDDGTTVLAPKRSFVTELAVPPCNGGALPWGDGYLSFAADFTGTGRVSLDVSVHDGIGWHVTPLDFDANSARKGFKLPNGAGKVSIMRKRQSPTDTSDTVPVAWLLEYGRR
jgi:hypothetical protein